MTLPSRESNDRWDLWPETREVGRDLSGMPVFADRIAVVGPKPTSPVEVMPVSEHERVTDGMVDRAAREMHERLEGFFHHIQADDPWLRDHAEAIVRAALADPGQNRLPEDER